MPMSSVKQLLGCIAAGGVFAACGLLWFALVVV